MDIIILALALLLGLAAYALLHGESEMERFLWAARLEGLWEPESTQADVSELSAKEMGEH